MKVRTVEPGIVKQYHDGKGFWTFTILYDGVSVTERESYTAASIAKQKMREKVRHERIRHGVTLNNGE